MRTWMYSTDRKLTTFEQNLLAKAKRCLACEGFLLRLAERESMVPYHWIPTGFICSACNVVYVEDNR